MGFGGAYRNEITIFIGLERFDLHDTQYSCCFPQFQARYPDRFSSQITTFKELSLSQLANSNSLLAKVFARPAIALSAQTSAFLQSRGTTKRRRLSRAKIRHQ